MRRRDFLGSTMLGGAFALFGREGEAGPCAIRSPSPYVFNDPALALPPDGGVVLALQQGVGGPMPQNGQLFPSSIALVGEHGPVPHQSVEVAPSLRILRPTRPPRGALTVRGLGPAYVPGGAPVLSGEVRVQFTAQARPLLAAPVVSEVTVRYASGLALAGAIGPGGRNMGPPPPQYLALFSAPCPAEAAFIVVAMANARTPGFQGFCAGALSPNARSASVYWQGGRCSPRSPDSPPSQGMSVVTAYVDRYGRLSAPSAPLAVTRS